MSLPYGSPFVSAFKRHEGGDELSASSWPGPPLQLGQIASVVSVLVADTDLWISQEHEPLGVTQKGATSLQACNK
eukprot:7139229-Karenia_brevis.AAC.1